MISTDVLISHDPVAMHKFKRFRGKYAKAMAWPQKVYQYKPGRSAHWQLIAFT